MDKFVVRYNVVENEAVDAIEKSGVFGFNLLRVSLLFIFSQAKIICRRRS